MTSWRSASSATAEAPRIHWENAGDREDPQPQRPPQANFPASLLAPTTSSRRAASTPPRAVGGGEPRAADGVECQRGRHAAPFLQRRGGARAVERTSRPRRSKFADASLRPRSTASILVPSAAAAASVGTARRAAGARRAHAASAETAGPLGGQHEAPHRRHAPRIALALGGERGLPAGAAPLAARGARPALLFEADASASSAAVCARDRGVHGGALLVVRELLAEARAV